MQQIRIAWRSRCGTMTGEGTWREDTPEERRILEWWCEDMNKKFPSLNHVIETQKQ